MVQKENFTARLVLTAIFGVIYEPVPSQLTLGGRGQRERERERERDVVSSALPWQQRGDTMLSGDCTL